MPLGPIILLDKAGVSASEGFKSAMGHRVLGIPLGLIFVLSGPLLGVAVLLGSSRVRAYFRQRPMAVAALLVGLLAVWSENPVFQSEWPDALDQGGFQLWGRLFLSLVFIAAFRRLTRDSPSSG